jgi:hypothetical protein
VFRNVPKLICDIISREYRNYFSYIRSGYVNADAPQKPPSARLLFLKKYFEDLKAANQQDVENGGQPVKGATLSGIPSALWKKMGPEERKPFEDAAALAQFEEADRIYYSKQPRIPKAPTKANYLYSSANPDGPAWGTLSDEDKQPYRNQELQARTAYEAELATFNAWCAEHGQDAESLVHGFPRPQLAPEKTKRRRETNTETSAESKPPKEKKQAKTKRSASEPKTKPKRTKSTEPKTKTTKTKSPATRKGGRKSTKAVAASE